MSQTKNSAAPEAPKSEAELIQQARENLKKTGARNLDQQQQNVIQDKKKRTPFVNDPRRSKPK